MICKNDLLQSWLLVLLSLHLVFSFISNRPNNKLSCFTSFDLLLENIQCKESTKKVIFIEFSGISPEKNGFVVFHPRNPLLNSAYKNIFTSQKCTFPLQRCVAAAFMHFYTRTNCCMQAEQATRTNNMHAPPAKR